MKYERFKGKQIIFSLNPQAQDESQHYETPVQALGKTCTLSLDTGFEITSGCVLVRCELSVPDHVDQGTVTAESAGSMPRLRPGDVIRVGKNIGVITKAHVVIDGSRQDWDWDGNSPGVGFINNTPTYSVTFRSGTGRKAAWWLVEELDEMGSISRI